MEVTDYMNLIPQEVPTGLEEKADEIRKAVEDAAKNENATVSVVRKMTKGVYFQMEAFRKQNVDGCDFYIGATRAIIQLGIDKLVPYVKELHEKYEKFGPNWKEEFATGMKDAQFALNSLTQYAVDDESKQFLEKYKLEWGKEVEDLYYEDNATADDYKYSDNPWIEYGVTALVFIVTVALIELIANFCLNITIGLIPLVIISSPITFGIKKAIGKRKK